MKKKGANKQSIRVLLSGAIVVFFLTSSIAGADVIKVNEEILEEEKDIAVSFSFQEPVISEVKLPDRVYEIVELGDLPDYGVTGQPILPTKPVNILLPYNAKLDEINIRVEASEPILVGEEKVIMPKSEPMRVGDEPSMPTPDPEIYESSEMFPGSLYTEIGVHIFRGFPILTVNLHPVQYIPKTGEVYYYEDMTLIVEELSEPEISEPEITKQESGPVGELYRGLEKDREIARGMVDNPSMVDKYPGPYPSGSYEYVIITSNALNVSVAGPDNDFQDLAQSKINKGLGARIVTVEYINANYAGVDLPEKIRNFIRYAYQNWQTEYVLLGGDADASGAGEYGNIVPARYLWIECYPGDSYGDQAPCDVYYGCLDGSYNSDGDDRWGEMNDGPGGGDVDLRAEVYVGRAPVDNLAEMSNFVKKTLAYESTTGPYLDNVTLAGEYLGFGGPAEYGGANLDMLINGSNAHGVVTVGIPNEPPSERYNISTLYDRDWPGNDWPVSELVGRMNNGVHLISHDGHANVGIVMKMVESDVTGLTNDDYFFAYSIGCYCGSFDNIDSYGATTDDCIAENFLEDDHGAFAIIMNARYGWGYGFSTDGPGTAFEREFWDAIYGEGFRDLGRANQDSKEDNIWRITQDCIRWTFYETNLLGDPEIEIKPAEIPDDDVGVRSINNPTQGELTATGNISVEATIRNYGLNSQSSIPVNCSIYKIDTTVHFEDNMESGAGKWTVVDNNGDSNSWTILSIGDPTRYNSPTHAFKCTPGTYYSANADDDLISDKIDLSGVSTATVEFYLWYYGQYDGWVGYLDYGSFYLSDDNGTTWTLIKTDLCYVDYSATLPGVFYSFPVEAYVNLTDEVRIKFNWQADGSTQSEGMYVDDVKVYTNDCTRVYSDEETISSLSAGSHTSVQFSPAWNASVESMYAINVTAKLTGDEDPSNNYKNITMEVNNVQDLGVESINYPPLLLCTGSHTVNATVKNYGNVNQIGANVNCSIYQMTGGGVTLLDEDFEGAYSIRPSFPANWNVEDTNGDGAIYSTYTYRMWGTYSSSSYARSGTMMARYYRSTSVAADDWFFTPGLSLSSTEAYVLSFWYAAYSSSYTEKMSVWIGTSNTSAGMTTLLWNNSNIVNPYSAYEEGNVTVTVPSSGTYYIGFYCYSDAYEYYLFVDDIKLYSVPRWSLVHSDDKSINIDGGDFKYVDFDPWSVSTETTYAINVSTSLTGDEDTSNDYKNITVTVQDIDDVGALSINYPTGVITTTKAHAVNATVKNFGTVAQTNVLVNCSIYQKGSPILSEDFEGTTPPSFPVNWNVSDDNGDGVLYSTYANYMWGTYSSSTYARSGTKMARYRYHSSNPANDWFFTPGLSLSSTEAYVLSFWYACYSSSYPEKMSVWVGTSNTSAGMTTQIWDNSNIVNTYSSYEEGTASFIVPSSGTYYIGFKCYSAANMYYLYVDDISLYNYTYVFGDDEIILSITAGEEKYVEFDPWTVSTEADYSIAVKTVLSGDENNDNNATGVAVTVEDIHDVGAESINYPASVYPTGTYTVNATVKNHGNVDQTNVPVNCSIYKKLLIEDFEGAYSIRPNPPAGWTVEDNNTDGYTSGSFAYNMWGSYYSTSYAHSGTMLMRYEYSAYVADDWFFTPALSLSTGETYMLSFWYACYMSSDPESMSVWIGTSNSSGGMTTELWNESTIDNHYSSYEEGTASFTVSSSGTYYIGFKCYSAPNMYYLFVDDIKLYSLDYVYADDETIASLAAGEETYVEFTPPWTVSTEADYIIKVTTLMTGDEDNSNNATEEIITVWDIDDVGTTSINYPTGTKPIEDSPFTVNATVKNFGNVAQSSVPVNCSIYKMKLGTILFSEDFEGGLPGTWTVVNGGDAGAYPGTTINATWTDLDPAGRGPKDGCEGIFMIVDSDKFGSGTKVMDEQLIMPAMSCAGQSKVILEFDHYYYHYGADVAYLDIKIGAGSWTNIDTFTTSDEGHKTYDISSYAAGQPSVQLRWHYKDNGAWAWYWEVDNVKISGAPTYKYVYGDDETIASLAAGEETYVEFTPPWTVVTGAGNYVINVTTMMTGDEFTNNDSENITVFIQGQNDTGVKSINYPPAAILTTGTYNINATVKNYGKRNQTNAVVNCTIRNSLNVIVFTNEKTIPSLPTGGEKDVEFDAWTVSIEDTYSINVTTKLIGDANPDNDWQNITVTINNIYDVMVVSINDPTGTQFKGTYTVNATVMNYGNVNVPSFNVNCTIRDSTHATVFTDEKTIAGLNVAGQIYVEFDPWNANIEDTYSINVTTLLGIDEDTSNDYQNITLIINDIDDVGVESINYPNSTYPTGSHAVNATVRNYGNVGKTNVPVNCSIYIRNTLLFSEDFEGATAPLFPTGWATEDGTGDGYTSGAYAYYMWGTYDYATYAHSGTISSRYDAHSSNPCDDWFFTPGLSLTAGTYEISFWYRAYSTSYQQNMSVWVGTSQASAGMTAQVWSDDDVRDTTYKQAHAVFTVSAGTYYLGFYSYGPPSSGNIYVDDIEVYSLTFVWGDDKTVDVSAYSAVYVEFDPWTVSIEGDYLVNVKTLMAGDEDSGNDAKAKAVTINNIQDVGATAINSPTGMICTGTHTVNATIKNFGNVPQTNVPVNCSIYRKGSPILSEDFEGLTTSTFPPTGWTVYNTGTSDGWFLSTSSTYAHSGSNAVRGNPQTGSSDEWLITPQLSITAANTLLSFWYRSESASYDISFEVLVSTTTNDTSSFTDQIFVEDNFTSATYLNANIILGGYVGENIYIAFHLVWGESGSWYMFLDDVEVYSLTYVFGDDETISSITAGEEQYIEFDPWTVGTEADYIIKATTMLTGDEDNTNNATQTTVTVEDIYDVGATVINYPPSFIGTGTHTVNATVKNFGNVPQTNVPVRCSIYQLVGGGVTLLSEDFEGVYGDRPNPPANWKIEDTNGDGYTSGVYAYDMWGSYYSTSYPHSGTMVMRYDYSSSIQANDWLFTQGVSLSSGVTYDLSFWYAGYSSSYTEKMSVWIGTSNSSGGMTTELWNNSNIVNPYSAYEEGTASFTVPSSGTYYIGFYCYSDAYERYLFVDDVELSSAPIYSIVYSDDETIASLAGGEEAYVEFTPPWTVSAEIDYFINVTTLMAGDENNTNNATEFWCVTVQDIRDVGVVSINAPAVTVEGFYDFESDDGGWIPWATWDPVGDWEWTDSYDGSCYVPDGDGSTGNPPPTAHSGTGLWATKPCTDYTNSGGETYLSQTFDFSGVSPGDATFSFWSWPDAFAEFDYCYVLVNGVQEYYTEDYNPADWEFVSLDLSAYAGMSSVEITFGMHASTVVSYAGWYIDDVAICGGGGGGGSLPAGSYTVNATVKNYGTTTETFDVQCNIYGYGLTTTTVFEDDMESGEGSWTHSGTPDLWHLTDRDYHSYNHSWYCGSETTGQYEDNMDDVLVSDYIDLTGATSARLTYWVNLSTEYGYDYYAVEASSNGVDWDWLIGWWGTSDDWWQDTSDDLDLTPYCGSTIQIRFRFHSDSSVHTFAGVFIDDVTVQMTTKTMGSLIYTSTETVTNLAGGAEQYVEFTPPWKAVVGEYTISVKTLLTGDEDTSNDEKTKDVIIKPAIIPPTPPTPPTLPKPKVLVNFTGPCIQITTLKWEISPTTLICFDMEEAEKAGIVEIYYQIDYGPWMKFSETGCFTLPPGVHHILYYGVDKNGFHSEIVHITIVVVGMTAPTTTCTLNPPQPDGNDGWYTSAVIATLTTMDEEGDDFTIYYKVDDDAWAVYTQPFIVDDGTHTISYYSIDEYGKEENIKTKEIKVDLYAPEISINRPTNHLYIFDREILPLPEGKTVIIGKITIEATVRDPATSGVASAFLYVDEDLKETFNKDIVYTLDETLFGVHTIQINAYDIAGNEAREQIKARIYNVNPKK